MSATDLYTLFYQWINTFEEISDESNYAASDSDYQEDVSNSHGKDNRFIVNY